MREWLIFLAQNAILIVDAIALVVIVIGTTEAFGSVLRTLLSAGPLAV